MTRECPLCARSRHLDVVVNGAWRLVRCVECGEEEAVPEGWQLRFADVAEVAVYCPECAQREFGEE